MNRLKCFLVLAALASPVVARAQTYGQFGNPRPVPVNEHVGGAYLQSSENVLAILTQLRMSFYPDVDFGFMGGIARQDFGDDDITTLRLGADIKYEVMKGASERAPSVSIGGALGVETGDNFNILSLGPTVVLCWDLQSVGGGAITPYAGAGVLFSNINVDPADDSDMSFPLRFGADFRINPALVLNGELQFRLSDDFNDDFGFSVGVNAPF